MKNLKKYLALLVFGFALSSLPSCKSKTNQSLEKARSKGGELVTSDRPTAVKSDAKRVALVIGNGGYQSAPLENPANDAVAVSDCLSELGFTVIKAIDQNREGMKAAIRSFRSELEPGAMALFFFAGHGMELEGRNFLIPTDYNAEEEYEVEDEAIDVELILRAMVGSDCRLKMVILDCCRDNPLSRNWRSGSTGGLAQMAVPEGSLLCYATSPGKVAADGQGKNSPFTSAFVKALEYEGLSHDLLFRKVKVAVAGQTQNRQRPWTSDDLLEPFYFRPGKALQDELSSDEGIELADRQSFLKQRAQIERDFRLALEQNSMASWARFEHEHSKDDGVGNQRLLKTARRLQQEASGFQLRGSYESLWRGEMYRLKQETKN